MKRVLVYSDRSGIFGAEQIDHRLVLGLVDAGLDVCVAQPPADHLLARERRARGIRHHDLPEEDIYDLRRAAPSLDDDSAAAAVFTEARPDLVLFTDSFPCANLAAKREAAERRLPFLVLVHCVQPAWADEYADYVTRLPALYAAAHEVVAVSQDNLALLRRRFGLPRQRGRVIYNGRPDEYFAPTDVATRQRVRAACNVREDELLVLTLGRYEHAKGYDAILASLPQLLRLPQGRRLRFLWVGQGSREAKIRALARMLGGDRVQVQSVRHDVVDLLDAADVLLHPARFEGMPLVVLEAMAKRLPVLASAIGGNVEALGDTGMLLPLPVGSPEFAAHLVEGLAQLSDDASLRRRLGDAAHARAERLFRQSRMVAEYVALVRQALGRG